MHPTMKNPNAPRIVTVKAVRRESLKVVVVDLADWHARNSASTRCRAKAARFGGR